MSHLGDNRRIIPDRLPLGPGAEGLSSLVDSLVALRLEIAGGTEAGQCLRTALGAEKLLQAQAALEMAIQEMKRLLGKTDRR